MGPVGEKNSAAAKRLLIIEDAVEIQVLLRKLFEMEGYAVDCAFNGQEALDFLTKSVSLPNLILLDLMMPVMDGYEFRKRQQAIPAWSQIPILVMTANGDSGTKQAPVGAIGFLRKPVDVDELLSTVERHAL